MPSKSSAQNQQLSMETLEPYNEERTLTLLREGTVEVTGQFPWSSNFTFLARVIKGQQSLQAVYKPTRGERPLWDFPRGSLAAREVAAYLTSESLGWHLIPPTVMRDDGPAGPGSLQLYIENDLNRHYFTLSEAEKERLRPVAVFDMLINNADRKGGHILLTPEGKIWLIDHGVCFHPEDKLRTVVWDFVGEPIPKSILENIQSLLGHLKPEDSLVKDFEELLKREELSALIARAERILQEPRFPEPGPGRPYPWPLV